MNNRVVTLDIQYLVVLVTFKKIILELKDLRDR